MNDEFEGLVENDEIDLTEQQRIKDIEMSLQHKKRCPKCNKYFVNKGIKSHFLNCHGVEEEKEVFKEHPCVFCGVIFDSKQKVSVHQIRCVKNPNRIIHKHKYTEEQRKRMSEAQKASREKNPQVNGRYIVNIKSKSGDIPIVIVEDF